MTIAAQLRVAIALLIALLVAILLAAFYVPSQLQRSANEKYVEDAIPLRYHVQDLAIQTARQQAAVEGFLRTREPARQERYIIAANEANADLARMRPLLGRHPRMFALTRTATGQISELQGAFDQQMAAVQAGSGLEEAAQRADRALRQFSSTVNSMIDETDSFVAEAEREQRDLYRQLLFVLGSLGVLALGIGVALFLIVPRRLGQLYEAEQQSRREAESRAEAARALAHVSDGVILTDADGRVRFWNPAAEKLTGVDEDGAIGRELARLLPGWERLAQQPEGQSGFGGAAVLPIHLGRERWLSVMSVDFGDGVVYAVRDVTEERALETLRSDFVATASHELRTPMTSISGAARTLLRHGEQLPPERHRDFLEMIVGESDRLARIVDQILVASRIEAGKIDVSFERVDATGIARSVVESAKHRAPHGDRAPSRRARRARGRLRPRPAAAGPRQHRRQRDQVLARRGRRSGRAARRGGHGAVRRPGRGHGLRALGGRGDLRAVPPTRPPADARDRRYRPGALHRARARPAHGRTDLGRVRARPRRGVLLRATARA